MDLGGAGRRVDTAIGKQKNFEPVVSRPTDHPSERAEGRSVLHTVGRGVDPSGGIGPYHRAVAGRAPGKGLGFP